MLPCLVKAETNQPTILEVLNDFKVDSVFLKQF